MWILTSIQNAPSFFVDIFPMPYFKHEHLKDVIFYIKDYAEISHT